MTLGYGLFTLKILLDLPLARPGFVGLALSLALVAGPVGAADSPRFALPIDCVPGATCFVQNYVDHDPSSAWRDYACGARSYDGHDGTDFRVPSMAAVRTGVAVLAAADGVVAGTRDGMPDGSIRENGKEAVKDRECGNGLVLRHADGWETQYCHLAQGSVAVRRGQTVRAGARLGSVGLSGLTEVQFGAVVSTSSMSTQVRPPPFGDTRIRWAGAPSGTASPPLAYQTRTTTSDGSSTGRRNRASSANAGACGRPATASARASVQVPCTIARRKPNSRASSACWWMGFRSPAIAA